VPPVPKGVIDALRQDDGGKEHDTPDDGDGVDPRDAAREITDHGC
jgi:hypothetical protein